jgi:hypothetical protein
MTTMLDIEGQAEIIINDQTTTLLQAEQGKIKETINQIAKKVPQLILLATTTVASVDPNTIGLPPHTR